MDIHHVSKASKSLRLDFRWGSLEDTKKGTLNNSVKGLWAFVKNSTVKRTKEGKSQISSNTPEDAECNTRP